MILLARTHPSPPPSIFFVEVEKWDVPNRPKQAHAKFHGCTTSFQGVNGRSKFRIFKNAEFQTAVYPPKIGRTAVKFCMRLFWINVIPKISLFDAEKKWAAADPRSRPVRDQSVGCRFKQIGNQPFAIMHWMHDCQIAPLTIMHTI